MYTYPKTEKLKAKKHIEKLFTEGKSVSNYPLRLVYVPVESNEILKMGVSVSKRFFKKAVDRNYYKRILRECYRKNQDLIKDNLNQPHAIMLFYQTKKSFSAQEIEEKTVELFKKLNDLTNENN